MLPCVTLLPSNNQNLCCIINLFSIWQNVLEDVTKKAADVQQLVNNASSLCQMSEEPAFRVMEQRVRDIHGVYFNFLSLYFIFCLPFVLKQQLYLLTYYSYTVEFGRYFRYFSFQGLPIADVRR